METVIVAYVPVIHAGYLNFFAENPAQSILLIDPAQQTSVKSVAGDMRAIPARDNASFLSHYFSQRGILTRVSVATKHDLFDLALFSGTIVMPEEDVSRFVAEQYFPGKLVSWKNIFLRWNWGNVTKEVPVVADVITTSDSALISISNLAKGISKMSSDWWRQVGAVLIRNGEPILTAYNRHYPNEQSPYIVGDPRSPFGPGERIELSSAHHAEKGIIATAARLGIQTEGMSMLVTTFPCPVCAMDIAVAGIKKVYYCEGYSLVNAEEILRCAGVSLVKITTPE